MSVRKGNKIIAGSYAVVKPEVYTKVETDDLLNQKQDKLIAGNNIFIDENNVISSSGGSGSFINVVQETGDSTEDVMSQASVTYELEQKANTIDLADVSLSGDYEDLSNTPDLSVYTKTEDLAEIAFTADYEDLGNTPDLTLYAKNEELSKVATTNNYNDLDNKPNLELYDTTISVNNKLSLKQDLLTAGEGISIEGNTISSTINSAEWGNIIGDITNQADLQEGLNGKLGIDFDNITEEGVKNLANIIGTGDYMFDTRFVDHELTYEESKGWALQGTYVYEEAVAGSRYGYPDFYNKCVEEKDLGTPTETTLGESTITLYTNANGHTFYDIADKEAIDAWYSTYGIAWYYGVDTENERVFLPRTKWFIQPTGEITEVNSVNEAGLPNIAGELGAAYGGLSATIGGFSENNAFANTGADNYSGKESGSFNRYVNFDASRCSSVYGNSDTVQPPSINQLLYICVGNTNIESAVTDVIDVTTTENDTVPLGYSTYQNGIVPNTSWLKSQGQWNDGNVYITFYNEFVQKIGQSFASGYVKEITEEYDDYDLVINQDDMTFRLPLLDGSESVVDNSNVTMLCNGVTSYEYTVSCNGVIKHLQYWGTSTTGSERVDLTINGVTYSIGSNYGEGTFYNIPVKKGDTVSFTSNHTTLTVKQYFTPFTGNGSLYFKVANAVQNLELLDAGEVLESLADKISRQDCKAYVTETYVNGTSWYRVYNDGWCEQGGLAQVSTAPDTINLLKNYISTNYIILIAQNDDYTGTSTRSSRIYSSTKTISSFQIYTTSTSGGSTGVVTDQSVYWETKGYIA